MSNLVFPKLPGSGLSVTRTPLHSNSVQWTLSGMRFASTWETFPRYHYTLNFNFLRSGSTYQEFQQVYGFFARHRGQWDSFLFQDPEDQILAGHPFGVGNGSTTSFQIQRTMVPSELLPAAASRHYWPNQGDGYEPLTELAGAPTVYVNGTSTTAFSLGVNGLITFSSPPANGAVLTVDVPYWRRVCFAADTLPAERIVSAIWQTRSVELLSVKGGGGNTYVLPPAGVTFSAQVIPTVTNIGAVDLLY